MANLLPTFFEPLLRSQYGDEVAARIISGCHRRTCTTLRANALKADGPQIAAVLDEAGIPWSGVPWYGDAFVLEGTEPRALWELDDYKQGRVYVQSLSSMLPPIILDPKPGSDVLDMCAAPGGKTTQMAALGGPRVHITACEMNAPRAERLEANLARQGASNVTVMRVDARRMDDFFRFDQILLDAPCSGSGTLDMDDERMPKRFTEKLIAKSVASQRALLSKALGMLKPGGTLVYSTCSVLEQENEGALRACLPKAAKLGSFKIDPIVIPGGEEMPVLPTSIEGTLCLAPTERYEGFFVSRIKRIS